MPIRINRVYTRGGDQGVTSLIGGSRVPKDSLRIESYGTVDELNAVLGLVHAALLERIRTGVARPALDNAARVVERIQNDLFVMGADLATPPGNRPPQQLCIETRHVETLENWINEMNASLPELTSFILPGGGKEGASFHLARTVCRRTERIVLALSREEEVAPSVLTYLNRLSDLLFVLGRWVVKEVGEQETLWDPTRA